MAVNYKVDYNDKRFTNVEADKKEALSNVEETYNGMIDKSDKFYQDQIDASNAWADKQTEIQNQQTDFAIDKIEQQKEQTRKDYLKEQSGAYVDWQKQSNQYGANAEQMAASGLANTGYHESMQVSMYNTYQNRVTTAREVYNQAVLNYDNAIKDARLQNSAALAEIAANALQKQLELSLQGFQYKNQLIIDLADKKLQIDDTYYKRYQDVLNQINTENALAEEARQADMANARQQEQIKIAQREIALEEAKFKYEKEQDAAAKIAKGSSGGSSGGGIPKGYTKKTVKLSNGRTKTVVVKDEKSTGSSGSNKSSNPPVDMQSVLNLGYGPISASRAYELVKQGLATTYVKDGKTYFRKSAKYIKNQSLFG